MGGMGRRGRRPLRVARRSEVRTQFDDVAFRSTLEPSANSPIDTFFLAADGRYAAVQGTFLESDTARGHQMVVLLELDNARIVSQYNFIGVDRVFADE